MRAATLAAALLLFTAPTAFGASVVSRSGVRAQVAPQAVQPLQCLLNGLESSGYPVKFLRGYGHGTVRGSLHPSGMALDVNQIRRGVTVPRMPHNEIAIAAACGVISGAVWRNNDSGHFQVGGYGGRGHSHKHRRHRR